MAITDTLWKWLMHTDAKALFVVSLLAFMGVTIWRGAVEYSAMRPERPVEHTPPSDQDRPDLPAYTGLGLQQLVSSQLAQANAAIPVNPFRPTAEDLAVIARTPTATTERPTPTETTEQEERVAEPTRSARPPTETTTPAETPFETVVRRGQRIRQPRQPDGPPRLTFQGMMRGPDGRSAVWLFDSEARASRFHSVGEDVLGASLLQADMRGLRIRLPDGREETLHFGETVELTEEADES